jgi:glycine/D-amino acid oxidase-like deaminating enzyme
VAGHPLNPGLSPAAIPHVEYPFATGDRADVMFGNHMPDRTVFEAGGECEVCTGTRQAIRYWSLAAADAGYPLPASRVWSLVVAYATEYPRTHELTDRYDISLLSVSREQALAGAR